MEAARRTFQNQPSLPLERPGADTGGTLQDQRRLSGAFYIKLENIRPDPNQPRKTFDADRQRELVDSIRSLGILQPISVRFIPTESVYYVIAGERRYQAAKEAGLSELPCWVQRPEDRDVLVHQIVENWQRADLHPFDLADALAKLRDAHGYTQADLARLTGKPGSEISRLLSLLKLDPHVQKEARSEVAGEVTRRHLLAIATANPATQQQVYHTVKERGLNALETERFVQDTKARAVRMDRRGSPPAQRIRFKTKDALVLLQFRRGKFSKDDVLAALNEAKTQAEADRGVWSCFGK